MSCSLLCYLVCDVSKKYIVLFESQIATMQGDVGNFLLHVHTLFSIAFNIQYTDPAMAFLQFIYPPILESIII